MKNYLLALAALSLGLALAAPPAAHANSPEKKAAANKPAPKASAKKPAASKEDEEDPEPDVSSSVAVDYTCELGNKLTIYANLADDQHVVLRWNKRLIRLERVGTSTGANRFESRRRGLIWIGIPAKGLLLDSRKGQQLANECRNAEQMAMMK